MADAEAATVTGVAVVEGDALGTIALASGRFGPPPAWHANGAQQAPKVAPNANMVRGRITKLS